MARTALLYAVAAVLIGVTWARLEQPARGRELALMLVLAALPAFAARFRALALAAATLAALELAVGLSPHRFWKGFVGFYDFRVPFDPRYHPLMHGDIELAVFGFAAAAGLALAGRRRLVAVLVLLVGAGWPATLAGGSGQLLLGGLILAGALLLLTERAPREALTAAALVVVAGTAAASSPALAKQQLLGWQHWDIRRPSTAGVSVAFAWNADYTGTRFPKRATKVFTVAAPPDSRYWRATTLDIFSGDRWLEGPLPWIPGRSRVDFAADDLAPAGARDQRAWVRQEVTIAALGDSHLLAASEPVAFDAGRNVQIQYAGSGNALVAGRLSRGSRYTAWSYAADPAPDALARSPARYPAAVVSQGYLDFQGGVRFPSFGAVGRAAVVRAEAGQYAPLYARAERVAAGARSPYAAALQLEEWFRSGGGFRYDEQPPRVAGVPPLVGFVLDTRRGYCQHYAGAMALMLRMLGVPARVAVGFRTGVYDDKTGVWTVTDRDAHAWVEAWFAGYGWLPFDPTPGREGWRHPTALPRRGSTLRRSSGRLLLASAVRVRSSGSWTASPLTAPTWASPREVAAPTCRATAAMSGRARRVGTGCCAWSGWSSPACSRESSWRRPLCGAGATSGAAPARSQLRAGRSSPTCCATRASRSDRPRRRPSSALSSRSGPV